MSQSPTDLAPLFNTWTRCHTMVLSWILNSLSKQEGAKNIYLRTN